MSLKDIKTLSEIHENTGIPIRTLNARLKNLEEGIDYIKLKGRTQPVILSKEGVEKIVKGKGDN